MKTKAVRIYGVHDLRLEEFELPEMGEDEIQARIITDSLCLSPGKFRTRVPSTKSCPTTWSITP